MINPNKPVRFRAPDTREVTVIGTMPNGDVVVTSTYGNGAPWTTPLVFDRANGTSRDSVSTLRLENKPLVSYGYYPVRARNQGPYGRGLTTEQGARSDYPEADGYLEITYQDGKPTGARIL